MQFNSYVFAIFLLVVLCVTRLTPKSHRWAPLLFASYVFYGWWRVDFLLLIAFSTLVDYCVGLLIERSNRRHIKQRWLAVSLILNLGLLGAFKYADFFISNLNTGLHWISQAPIPELNWILPVGISFYTFQTLSYSIDVYRGHLKAERHCGRFALYVIYFPQLVAGPIERATRLLPQLQNKISISSESVIAGGKLFCWGLFKKIVVADRVGLYVVNVFENPLRHQGITVVIAAVFFAIQIYADFSAYCDMARGCSRMLGIELMENFKMPYLASSFRDFWSRWHISLSTWFRDYLYIPLGGNRCSFLRTSLNLWVVFLVSGLWHGANWTFMLWGALHGAMLSIQGLWNAKYPNSSNLNYFNKTIYTTVTFTLVCLFWIPFRANDLSSCWIILKNIFYGSFWAHPVVGMTKFNFTLSIVFTLVTFLIDWRRDMLKSWLLKSCLPLRWASYYALLLSCYFFHIPHSPAFIYFQF
jgi:alginate O-acetyltransferase complex protein AlgI